MNQLNRLFVLPHGCQSNVNSRHFLADASGYLICTLRVLLFVLLCGGASSLSAAPPNVVLIVIDDLGWADLGCYGSTFHKTPQLDKLAKEGLRFTDAYAACPVCSPTRAAIMTGKWPARLNLTDWLPGRGDQPRPALSY